MKITKEMFDAIKIKDGKKHYPLGDYSGFDKFESNCVFKNYCSFGENVRFGDDCVFGYMSTFGQGCSFGSNCKFGSHSGFGEKCDFGKVCYFEEACNFGFSCSFDRYCIFNDGCMFNCFCGFEDECVFRAYCSFGDCCDFGSNCFCEFGQFDKMIFCGGFGRYSRTTYFFLLTDKRIFVRCGCFRGSLQEWIDQVCKTHKDTYLKTAYLALIPAVKAQFEED